MWLGHTARCALGIASLTLTSPMHNLLLTLSLAPTLLGLHQRLTVSFLRQKLYEIRL